MLVSTLKQCDNCCPKMSDIAKKKGATHPIPGGRFEDRGQAAGAWGTQCICCTEVHGRVPRLSVCDVQGELFVFLI